MSDIDVKPKPVSYTPYIIPCIVYPGSNTLWNTSQQYAADLGSNPLQFQQTIVSSMMKRSPRGTMEMGDKILNIVCMKFIEQDTFVCCLNKYIISQ